MLNTLLLHLVQRGGEWSGQAAPSPLLAVPDVTANPSSASVPTSCYSIWHYNCLCAMKLTLHSAKAVTVPNGKLNECLQDLSGGPQG